jgi:hypothetical protein
VGILHSQEKAVIPSEFRHLDRISPSNVLLAHELKDLEHRAIAVYEPIVKPIISSRSIEVGYIEQTLDGLLDFAGSDDASTSQIALPALLADRSSRDRKLHPQLP